jgi:hypothetical protein
MFNNAGLVWGCGKFPQVQLLREFRFTRDARYTIEHHVWQNQNRINLIEGPCRDYMNILRSASTWILHRTGVFC